MDDFGEKVAAQAAIEIVKVLGRAAKGWWDDHQERRRERLDNLGRRVGNILNIGAVTPETVADKLAVPILQAASLEDDETLQEKWAGLLASAADPASRDNVHPSFPELLRGLSPQEAKFLDGCLEATKEARGSRVLGGRANLWILFAQLGLSQYESRSKLGIKLKTDSNESEEMLREDQRAFAVVLDHLEALRLLTVETNSDFSSYLDAALTSVRNNDLRAVKSSLERQPNVQRTYSITQLGLDFIRACAGPQPKSAPT